MAPESASSQTTRATWRALELDTSEDPNLDPHSIVVGSQDQLPVVTPTQARQEPTVVWQGEMDSDGSGPQRTYYVRLYTDGGGHCSCPDYYFRGLLRRQTRFRCKHLVRAWAIHGTSGNSIAVSS